MRNVAMIALGLAGMALAACTPTTWHKDGVPASVAYEDEDECGRIGKRFALRYAAGAGLGFARIQPYRDYRYGPGIWFDRQFDRQMTESQVKHACMREKGYTLEPLAP